MLAATEVSAGHLRFSMLVLEPVDWWVLAISVILMLGILFNEFAN
jgi:hypothetical protein